MNIAARAARDDERAAVEAFYRHELKRDVPLEPGQEVFAAREGQTIVAALRLSPEAGTLVLRTVVVAEDRRGRGIGRALLKEASRAIGRRECWCFGWSYLEEFYASIGFQRVPAGRVPERLRDRLGPDQIATYRAPAS